METKTADAGAKSWLTVPEVARELQIPRSRAYELCARGDLPAVRIGERSIRVNRAELERFLMETRRVVASYTGSSDAGVRNTGEVSHVDQQPD